MAESDTRSSLGTNEHAASLSVDLPAAEDDWTKTPKGRSHNREMVAR
jgi:hypothetical protein